ncbi:MAG: 3-dehydroquinate synthase [Cyclobacteriaceae bacterium]|nr:3-dehydroquinate synthase [Cyclobacteriaceae bacterium]
MLPENILLTHHPTRDLQAFLQKKQYSKLAILMDENTVSHCYPVMENVLSSCIKIIVTSGEEQKNLSTCTAIWQAMTDHALDRHAALIVLGGGVLGDMGGFCAATYKRGIDFILIPTTLLAQADASIGGKLGIDFNHFKNHIGVFQQPQLTLLYSGFFKTLPLPELRSGFAEVIKHALISDRALWEVISAQSLSDQDWEALVLHSVSFKAQVTTEDPTEKGLRKILNAGHTLGHALESYLLSQNRKIMHGEAVAAGIICEAWIANSRNLLEAHDFQSITNYILNVFGRVSFNENEIQDIGALTLQDKKNKGSKILCVLQDGIGRARWNCEISLEEVNDALTSYLKLQM